MAGKKSDSTSPSAKEIKEAKEKEAQEALERTGGGERISHLLEGEITKAIKKKYGSECLFLASEARVQRMPRIPCGVFPIDLALGGGFPAANIHTVFGVKSSGKSTLICRTLGEAQQLCGTCWGRPGVSCNCGKFHQVVAAFIDPEGTLDLDWAKRQGVDATRLIISQPSFAEEAIDIADALLRSGEVDVLAMDSLAMLTPAKEIENSTDQETMGVMARIIGRAMRKFRSALNDAKSNGRLPTVFLTNQVRMKIGVMFGNPEVQPGGMAPGFANMTEIRMGAQHYEVESKTNRPLYVDINFKVEKNKSAVARKQGEFRLMLSDTETKKLGDVYDEGAMVEEGERCGLIEQKGGDWTCLGEKHATKSKIERRLLTEPEFKTSLREALFQVLIPA